MLLSLLLVVSGFSLSLNLDIHGHMYPKATRGSIFLLSPYRAFLFRRRSTFTVPFNPSLPVLGGLCSTPPTSSQGCTSKSVKQNKWVKSWIAESPLSNWMLVWVMSYLQPELFGFYPNMSDIYTRMKSTKFKFDRSFPENQFHKLIPASLYVIEIAENFEVTMWKRLRGRNFWCYCSKVCVTERSRDFPHRGFTALLQTIK